MGDSTHTYIKSNKIGKTTFSRTAKWRDGFLQGSNKKTSQKLCGECGVFVV